MDFVLCFQVIEHIRDDFGTINEIGGYSDRAAN